MFLAVCKRHLADPYWDGPQTALTGSSKTICIPAPQTTSTEEELALPFTEQDLKEEAFSAAGHLEFY